MDYSQTSRYGLDTPRARDAAMLLTNHVRSVAEQAVLLCLLCALWGVIIAIGLNEALL